jgi:HSP20 family protein
MNLVRFSNPMYRYNDLFNSEYNNEFAAEKRCAPAVNISENETSFVIEFSVPGYRKEQFSLMSDDGILKVKAQVEDSEASGEYRRREFAPRSFERLFNIPKSVAPDSIAASYQNGILEVVLPKSEEESKKQINIKIE